MPTTIANLHGSLGRAALGGAVLVLLAGLSSGCSTTGTSDVNPANYDSNQRHPILISRDPEPLDLPVGMRGPALSPKIERAIGDYVAQYRSEGTGPITIQAPTGSANEAAAAATGRAVHYALVRLGVPRNQIVVSPYAVDDHSKVSPLRLAFLQVKAVVPDCGLWPAKQPVNGQNAQYFDFGCAQQQNLAAMVADPADLVRPRAMTPASGARRAKVMQIYIEKGNNGWDPTPYNGLIEENLGTGG
jgi:pilus assembly protein CpaD